MPNSQMRLIDYLYLLVNDQLTSVRYQYIGIYIFVYNINIFKINFPNTIFKIT